MLLPRDAAPIEDGNGVSMSGAGSLNLCSELSAQFLRFFSQPLCLFAKMLQLANPCIVEDCHEDSV